MRPLAIGVSLLGTLCAAVPSLAQCPGDSVTRLGGIQDDFALPTEASEPSETFRAWADKVWPQITDRQFDSQVDNRALIHTFAEIPPGACGAVLELHLKAGAGILTSNDTVRLELLGGPDPDAAFFYVTTFRNVMGSWDPGSEATIELDLTDLPPYADYPTNILSALSDGSLDLLIEDDTAVDYALLRVCYCSTATQPTTWGRVKARFD
jgi:hypothetical protein